jgi:hypothetical protein
VREVWGWLVHAMCVSVMEMSRPLAAPLATPRAADPLQALAICALYGAGRW